MRGPQGLRLGWRIRVATALGARFPVSSSAEGSRTPHLDDEGSGRFHVEAQLPIRAKVQLPNRCQEVVIHLAREPAAQAGEARYQALARTFHEIDLIPKFL